MVWSYASLIAIKFLFYLCIYSVIYTCILENFREKSNDYFPLRKQYNSNIVCVQANVMLEYTLDDAELLLTKNHNAALKSLEVVDNDLGFLRDQTTTIEVSILSVWGVIMSEAELQMLSLLLHNKVEKLRIFFMADNA